MRTIVPFLGALGATFAVSAAAQDAPPPPPAAPPAAPPVAAEPAGQDWNAVSRSATRVYLVDVSGLKLADGVTTIMLARVPLSGAPTDRSHVMVEMEYRCGAKTSRAVAETEHDETGAALDRFDMGEDFAPYSSETLDGYIAAVACEGARGTPPTYPSIAAFIAAGRR